MADKEVYPSGVRIERENPDVPEDFFGIEYIEGSKKPGAFEKCNIHFRHFSIMNVNTNNKHNKYWLLAYDPAKGPKSPRYWIDEDKIEAFVNEGWRPPKVQRPPNTTKKNKTKVIQKSAQIKSKNCKAISNRCFITFVGYLTKWFTKPVWREMVPNPSTGNLDLHALTNIIISARSLAQFVAEANAFIPIKACKLVPEFDPSYLDLDKDDPNRPEDTITEIRLKQWYTELRAMCKAELTSLQFKYGTISKNSYAWLLERCFSKEFSLREQSKKSTSINVKTESPKDISKSKEKSDNEKVDNPALCDVQIFFDEEVNTSEGG